MEHKKPFKPIVKINRTAVERLAVLLFNNVIKDENISEMPIIDQANILLKCIPYLLEKKGSETMVSEKDVSNISRIASQTFIESKKIDDRAKNGVRPATHTIKQVLQKDKSNAEEVKRMEELEEKIKTNPNIIS